ncbi:MAG: hypothetical protein ACT4PL_05090, partial [Phycisphaerales bacterium]
IGYLAEDWRMWVSFNDGANALNTDFSSGSPGGARPSGESDWSFTARAEFKLAGKSFDEFKDFTSKEGSDFAALLGVAGHYQGSANTVAAADVDEVYLGYTADLTIKTGGLTGFIAFAGSNSELRAGGTDTDISDFGIIGQIAYRFTNTEPFVRYDGLFYDEDRLAAANDEEDQGFLTVGVNHYFAGHAAKLTVDAVVSLDDNGDNGTPTIAPNASASVYSNGQGLLSSPDSGQIAIRAQFQLMF